MQSYKLFLKNFYLYQRIINGCLVINANPCTDAAIVVGEVGGEQEEKAAGFISRRMTKPEASYIAGSYSPQGKRMGHAGATVHGTSGTVAGKQEALRVAGVTVLESPIHFVRVDKKI
jgi:succinyl-CoA synthetase alpha subunit